MSLYAEYIKEREGKDIIEDEKGFATYLYTPIRNEIYIVDVYVRPEYRRQGVARDYVDTIINIAKEKNCEYLITSVDLRNPDWKSSTTGLLNTGWKFYANDPMDQLFKFFKKELKNE